MEINLIESGKEEVFNRLDEVLYQYLKETMKKQDVKLEEVIGDDNIIKLEYTRIK